MQATIERVLSESERSKILDIEIQRYLGGGYRILSRTNTTAQLVKPKQFNAGIAILGALLLLIGLVIYLLAYTAQQDSTMYLSVDEQGHVTRQASGADARQAVLAGRDGGTLHQYVAGRTTCAQCGHANSSSRRSCKMCGVVLQT